MDYASDPIKARIFNSYRNMRQTCYNPNNTLNQIYARAGIHLECKFNSFNDFYNWVMETLGPPPGPEYKLVRKNMFKDYTKSNLEWNTFKEQQNRQRRCQLIKYKGRTQTLTQWAEELNISKHVLYKRSQQGIKNPKELFYKAA